MSDREHPDYKNCVKESISAVESVCKVLTNDPKAELGKALKSLIANGMNIHGSLKSAILALYGYASDEGGIRHAERETESTVTFEEAKFMMVTCSAIVNYLVAEYGTIPHFTKDKLSCVPFCLCPTGEQEEIADYLDAKCAEIDGLIAKKERLVKELESYKKSLIYEVVTGKREV